MAMNTFTKNNDLVCPRCGFDGFECQLTNDGDIDLTCYFCGQNGATEAPGLYTLPPIVRELSEIMHDIQNSAGNILDKGD